MNINKTRLSDLATKIGYIFLLAMIVTAYYVPISTLSKYVKTFEETNIYFELQYTFLILFVPLFLLIFYFFLEKIRKSKKNNTRIEKATAEWLNKNKKYSVPNTLYSALILIAASYPMLLLLEFVILIAMSTNQFTGIDYITLTKTKYYGYTELTAYLFSFISLLLFGLFLAIKPKEKLSIDFLYGIFVVPLILSFSFDITPFEFNKVLSILSVADRTLLESGHKSIVTLLVVISIMLVVYYLYDLYLNKKTLLSKLTNITLGYILSRGVLIIMISLFLKGETVKIYQNPTNIKTVNVYNKSFEINTTLLNKMEDAKLEELIKGYNGLSIHHSAKTLEELMHKDFQGDKEKAIKLLATVHLKNYQLWSAKKEIVIALLKEGVNSTDGINLLIPMIIYDAMPLNQVENSLSSAKRGQYQEAIDYYILDVLNNDLETKISFRDEIVNNKVIQNTYFEMIASIIINDYAVIDYSKIESLETRELLKKAIEQRSSPSKKINNEIYSNERMNKWYDVFEIK